MPTETVKQSQKGSDSPPPEVPTEEQLSTKEAKSPEKKRGKIFFDVKIRAYTPKNPEREARLSKALAKLNKDDSKGGDGKKMMEAMRRK